MIYYYSNKKIGSNDNSSTYVDLDSLKSIDFTEREPPVEKQLSSNEKA